MDSEYAFAIVQIIISGLLVGAVYALTACGLNLIFGVMSIMNMAHGELLMLGAFTTYGLFSFGLLSPIASLFVSIPLLFLFGVLLQRFLFERMVSESPFPTLLMSFGLSILIVSTGLLAWSANYRSIPYFSGSIMLGELALPRARLVTAAIAVALTAAAFLFLRSTKIGKAVRATAQNAMAARACGIDVRRVRMIAFGLGAAMAGAAGTLISMNFAFNPDVGQVFVLKCFAIVILGGLGSFPGAFIGALILGVVEGLTGFVFTSQVSEIASYLLIISVLLLRPTGILGLRR
jgi:branched-chain amino acid transport system permease protein